MNSNEGRYFTKGPRGNQALTESSIPIDWVTNESDRRVLETAKKSTALWCLFFQRVEANHSQNDEVGMNKKPSTAVNYADQLNEIQAANDGLKTPKRTRFKDMEKIIHIREPAIDTLIIM